MKFLKFSFTFFLIYIGTFGENEDYQKYAMFAMNKMTLLPSRDAPLTTEYGVKTSDSTMSWTRFKKKKSAD